MWALHLKNKFVSHAVSLITCLLASVTLLATPRTQQDAEREALRFLRSRGVTTEGVVRVDLCGVYASGALRQNCTVRHGHDAPFYIFDNAEGDAFVIVAGDSRANPLLGWSDASAFPADDIPEGLAWLLEWYACCNTPAAVLDDSSRSYPLVAPILRTHWGQGTPYNRLCPQVDGSYCYTGCVATAMAQIMYCFQHPAVGTGSFAYATDTYSCSFDFGSTFFDWDNMRTEYSGRYTETERKAVAELMYACGVSVGMAYSTSGSGAYSEDVPYALHHFFGYNPNIVHYSRDYFSESEWHSILSEELVAGRPVLYCGSRNEESGHAFVVDGCDGEGLYHVNWGWSGSADGYFSLDALAPYGGDAYGLWQSMVCHISPDTIGEQEDVFYADEIVVEDTLLSLDGTLHIEVHGVGCTSSAFSTIDSTLCFTGTVGIALYNDEMQFVRWLDVPDTISANLFVAYTLWYEIPMDAQVFTEGQTWWLIPAAQALEAAAPTPMHLLNTTSEKIPLFVQDGRVYIGKEYRQDLSVSPLHFPEKETLYDLQGRECSYPWKGIYIYKGEKKFF